MRRGIDVAEVAPISDCDPNACSGVMTENISSRNGTIESRTTGGVVPECRRRLGERYTCKTECPILSLLSRKTFVNAVPT